VDIYLYREFNNGTSISVQLIVYQTPNYAYAKRESPALHHKAEERGELVNLMEKRSFAFRH
jgi:hypothetical protein